jgi:ribose transport system ATP-binding protein
MIASADGGENAVGSNTVPLLEAFGLTKSFGPTEVLSDVSLSVRHGEIHAVVGENGAGKSTLMKILSGHLEPTRGTMNIKGQKVVLRDPVEAEQCGIVLVHQEILLAPHLTIAQNMFLGRELRRYGMLDDREMNRRAADAMRNLGADVSPSIPVERLSIAHRQLAQIARALITPHAIVIFDEPTASLTPVETDRLLRVIKDMAGRGVGALYISHRLNEVKAIADRITVLRDGKLIATRPARELEPLDMAKMMVGRDLSKLYPDRATPSANAPVLEVGGFSTPGFVTDASFLLRKGEILGFAGLVGAGRTELFESLLGLRAGQGAIKIDGRETRLANAHEAMRKGIVYLTEDRKGKGLLLSQDLAFNLTLAAWERFKRGPTVDREKERKALDKAIGDFDIRVGDKGLQAGQLSGGNQQKLLLAKMMLLDPQIVIIDEPTRGIDIGAKQQIYRFVADLAAEGRSVIVISSEMGELIGLCHRILVMRAGKIVGEVAGEAMTEHEIVVLATGAAAAEAAEVGA